MNIYFLCSVSTIQAHKNNSKWLLVICNL